MGLAPVQVPAWQVSVRVQALPSLQATPLALAGLLQVPLVVLHVPTLWHWSSGVHTTGLTPVQVPAWQVSVRVQALPSSQPLPSGLVGFVQTPLNVSQVPAAWHWSSGVHTMGLAPVQVPAWQVSVRVQGLPSLQTLPLVFAGLLHAPVVGLHAPTSWHWSSAAHITGLLPVQLPAWQVSVCVHPFPSLQTVPSALAGFEHAPVLASQVPTSWHWSLAVHTTGLPPVQLPAWQVSVCVHVFPSSQATPSAFAGLLHAPVLASQVPTSWHWSLAVHTTP
jgi:hypothetical protein